MAAYVFVSTMVVAVFVALNIPPPSILTVLDPSLFVQKSKEMVSGEAEYTFTQTNPLALVSRFMALVLEIMMKTLVGLPVLVYKFATTYAPATSGMTGVLALAEAVALILQISFLRYVIYRLTGK